MIIAAQVLASVVILWVACWLVMSALERERQELYCPLILVIWWASVPFYRDPDNGRRFTSPQRWRGRLRQMAIVTGEAWMVANPLLFLVWFYRGQAPSSVTLWIFSVYLTALVAFCAPWLRVAFKRWRFQRVMRAS